MTLNGRPINTNSREYIDLLKELENEDYSDAEICNSTLPYQPAVSWPASSESEAPALDEVYATEALGLPGVPYAERPERADEPAAVAFLTVRQAGA